MIAFIIKMPIIVPGTWLKERRYSNKIFFLFTLKLYLKWTKFLCNFTAWVCIETTGFLKSLTRPIYPTQTHKNKPFPTHELVKKKTVSEIQRIKSPRSIYLKPILSGHFSVFGFNFFALISLLGIARQWSREKLQFWAYSLGAGQNFNILNVGYSRIPRVRT